MRARLRRIRLRRFTLLLILALGINAFVLRHRKTFSETYPFPIVGYVIGFLGGVFVDRGVRESSIRDNVLAGSILAGLTGLYDYVNGITYRLRGHPYGTRLEITLIVLALVGIVSAIMNEVLTGRPGKIGTIAVAGAVLALVVFAFATQKVVVNETPVAVYDLGKYRGKFILVNTATGDEVAQVVSGQVTGANGTVIAIASVTENDTVEAYVQYVYVTIRDNDTGLRGGLYHFKIVISGVDDGVVRNDYFGNGSIEVVMGVLDYSLYTVVRRTTIYDGPVVNNGSIVVEFNATISHDVASMVNGDPDNRLRLEIGFRNYGLETTKRDKVSISVHYYLIETVEPNTNYVYLSIVLVALAVIDAIPEFALAKRRRRR